jgi:hypothetical protein
LDAGAEDGAALFLSKGSSMREECSLLGVKDTYRLRNSGSILMGVLRPSLEEFSLGVAVGEGVLFLEGVLASLIGGAFGCLTIEREEGDSLLDE